MDSAELIKCVGLPSAVADFPKFGCRLLLKLGRLAPVAELGVKDTDVPENDTLKLYRACGAKKLDRLLVSFDRSARSLLGVISFDCGIDLAYEPLARAVGKFLVSRRSDLGNLYGISAGYFRFSFKAYADLVLAGF